MHYSVNDIIIALTAFEVCGKTIPNDLRESVTEEMLNEIYKISKLNGIVGVISQALSKSKIAENFKGEAIKKFIDAQLFDVYRVHCIEYELDRIRGALEKAKIPFIPLKGSVIRKYYPEPWMRTSCDIDVLIHKEQLDYAIKYLTEKLNYKVFKNSYHDVSLLSESKVHLELHFDLIEENNYPKISNILSNAWDYARKSEGYEFMYELSDELFYFYHIAHMVKHFEVGGCSVIPILDLWLLNKNIEYDIVKRDALLEKGGLLKFSEAIQNLAEFWFSGAEADELTISLKDYILNESSEKGIAIQQCKKGGKFKYAVSRIFYPYNSLKYQYPIIKKYKILTPAFEVVRWVKIISAKRVGYAIDELRANSATSKEQFDSTASLLMKLGL